MFHIEVKLLNYASVLCQNGFFSYRVPRKKGNTCYWRAVARNRVQRQGKGPA